MMLLSLYRSHRKPASAYLVDQVCPVEQEVFPAELVVSEDPWTDGGCPGETICGSASPAHCHLHSPYRAGSASDVRSNSDFKVSFSIPSKNYSFLKETVQPKFTSTCFSLTFNLKVFCVCWKLSEM